MKLNLPLSGLLLFVFCAEVLAEGPEDQYISVYSLIQRADVMLSRGEDRASLDLYHKAQATLTQIKSEYPNWNSNIVSFRLKYLSEKLGPLEEKYPPTPKVDDSIVIPRPPGGLEEQLHRMNDELIKLRSDRKKLELKLKEALNAVPGQVDPATLDEARNQIGELNKQIDILKAIQESGSNRGSAGANEIAKQLKAEREKSERLEKENKKMEAVLVDPTTTTAADTLSKLERENEALKKKYQEALRQLFEKKKELIQ